MPRLRQLYCFLILSIALIITSAPYPVALQLGHNHVNAFLSLMFISGIFRMLVVRNRILEMDDREEVLHAAWWVMQLGATGISVQILRFALRQAVKLV